MSRPGNIQLLLRHHPSHPTRLSRDAGLGSAKGAPGTADMAFGATIAAVEANSRRVSPELVPPLSPKPRRHVVLLESISRRKRQLSGSRQCCTKRKQPTAAGAGIETSGQRLLCFIAESPTVAGGREKELSERYSQASRQSCPCNLQRAQAVDINSMCACYATCC